MKIVFKSDDLKTIINRVSKFTTARGLIPEFSYLVFKGDSVRASNGICGIYQQLPVNFGEDIVLLPAELFRKTISILDGDISLTIKDNNVILKAGKFTTKFQQPTFERGVWFELPNPDSDQKVPDDFFASLVQTFFVVPKQQSISAVNFNENVFYATDAKRMVRFKATFGSLEHQLNIPEALLSLVADEKIKLLGYSVDKDKIWFFFDEFIAFVCELDSALPEFGEAFEQYESLTKKQDEVKFDRPEVLKTLERLSIFQGKEGIDVCIVGNQMVLLVATPTAEVFEKVAVKSTGDGIFSINMTYFKEAIERSETFYFDSKDFRSPLYFKSNSGLDSVIMPLVGTDAERARVLHKCSEYLSETAEAGAESKVGADATGEASETKEA